MFYNGCYNFIQVANREEGCPGDGYAIQAVIPSVRGSPFLTELKENTASLYDGLTYLCSAIIIFFSHRFPGYAASAVACRSLAFSLS